MEMLQIHDFESSRHIQILHVLHIRQLFLHPLPVLEYFVAYLHVRHVACDLFTSFGALVFTQLHVLYCNQTVNSKDSIRIHVVKHLFLQRPQ